MNRTTKLALAAVAATALAASVQAQLPVSGYTQNQDQLLLGFTKGGSTGDLVIDLGTATQIGVGSGLSLNLNNNGNVGLTPAALLSELSTLYGGIGGLSFGVVGGHFRNASDSLVYATVAHGQAPPVIGAAGTILSAANTVGFTIDGSGSPANQIVVDPTKGYGNSWTEQIDKSTSAWQKNGTNPDSLTPVPFAAGVIVEDLYSKNAAGVESFAGTINLFADGTVLYSPTAVPEPTTFSLLGALGLLALAVRRLARKSA
jgi:hypothetical protein